MCRCIGDATGPEPPVPPARSTSRAAASVPDPRALRALAQLDELRSGESRDGRRRVVIESLHKLNGVSVWVLYPRDEEPVEPDRGGGQPRYADGGKGPVCPGSVLG